MSEPQFYVCPKREEHRWIEIRSKKKETDGKWFFFKRCLLCPALLETIVTHKENAAGDVLPIARSFLLTPGIDTAELVAEAR